MGDRANVLITDDYGHNVFLYTHWGGYDLPRTVQRALAKGERYNDSPYLSRIVFSEMIKHDIDGTTGYGISNQIGDNSYLIIHLDASKLTVRYITEAGSDHPNLAKPVRQWTMEEFAKATDIMEGWE